MSDKRLLTLIAICLVSVSILVACSSTPTPKVGEPPVVEPTEALPPEEPFVLRIGHEGDLIDCLNFAACTGGYNAWEVLYDHLWAFGEIGNLIQPELVQSWDISDDMMTWTMYLADLEGATFHDGTPLDAEAIAWSINYWATNDAISWFFGTEVGEGFGMEVIDDRTVVMHLLEPVTPDAFLSAVGYIYITPKNVWEEYDAESIYDFGNEEAIGSGQYKLVDFSPGEHIIFEAHEGHFRGKPPVDQIVVQNFTSQDAMVQALITGEIDAIFGIPPNLLEALQEVPDLTIVERSPGNNDTHLLFNMWEGGTRNAAIEDKVVRQAVAHAIDKQQIVDVVYAGHAIASDNFFDIGPRYEKWEYPTLKSYTFDLNLAASMLEDAGYVDSDGDGVREMNDGSGTPLNFRIYFDIEDANHLATAELISTWLSDIGVVGEVEGLDYGTMIDYLLGGDFDIVITQWGIDPDPDIMILTLHSIGVDWAINWAGYSNPELDELYFDQHFATDYEERRAVIWEILDLVHEEVPRIQLNNVALFDAYRSDRLSFPTLDTIWYPWQGIGIYEFERVE
jgi:peptide/nickel transport system substrate-binding protein